MINEMAFPEGAIVDFAECFEVIEAEIHNISLFHHLIKVGKETIFFKNAQENPGEGKDQKYKTPYDKSKPGSTWLSNNNNKNWSKTKFCGGKN